MATEKGGERLGALLDRIVGLIYVFTLTLRSMLRRYLERGARGLLIASLIGLVVDVLLDLFGSELATSLTNYVRVLFWVGVVAVLYSKIREWREHKQIFTFIESMKHVIETISEDDGNSRQAEEVLVDLLAITEAVYHDQGRVTGAIGFLQGERDFRIAVTNTAGSTAIVGIEFKDGEGCGAVCCSRRTIVYVPRVRFRHAILQGVEDPMAWTFEADVFVSRPTDDFKSIAAFPLIHGRACFGFLALASDKANAFRRIHLQEGLFFASAMAQVLHIHRVRGRPVE